MNVKSLLAIQGFTLLEVMIALTIFVTIALTLSQTASQSVDTVLYMQDKTLASMLAENQLNEQRLKGLPRIGENKDVKRFANRDWQVHSKVEKTEFPDTVRVTLSVADMEHKDSPLATIATIMGKY